jgi:hypothetical protein
VQVQQRIEALLPIRLAGAELWDIREFVREKTAANDPVWGSHMLSDSQLYRYLQRVQEIIDESCKTSRKRLFRTHLAKRRSLYSKAVATGDYATAKAILRDEAELLNLYPPKRTEMSGPRGGPIPTAAVELTDAERAAAIASLLGRTPRVGQADPRPAADRPGD